MVPVKLKSRFADEVSILPPVLQYAGRGIASLARFSLALLRVVALGFLLAMNGFFTVMKWVVIVVLIASLAGCNSGGDPVEGTGESAGATDAITAQTPTPTPRPATPTPVPATPVPTPTPDPLIVEAEDVATRYFIGIQTVADDARVAEIGELTRLEAQGSPLEDYALRVTASLLKSNHYFPFGDIRWEIIGSEIRNANVGAVDVRFCVQTPGLWRDFDTDEITRTSVSESALVTYHLQRDNSGNSLKVWSIDEDDGEGDFIQCEFLEETG